MKLKLNFLGYSKKNTNRFLKPVRIKSSFFKEYGLQPNINKI